MLTIKDLLSKPLTLLLTTAMTSGALIAGCGGESPSGVDDRTYSVEADTTMTTAPISREQFIRHINRTCRQAWSTILKNFEEYWDTHPNLSRKERFAEGVRIPVLAGITFLIFDDIHLLGAPRGDERKVEEMIGVMQEAVELGQKRRPLFHSAAQISEHFDEYNRRARRYGLVDCLVNEPHLRGIDA